MIGLRWTEVDLDQGVADIIETGSGDGPKSQSGKRAVPVPGLVVDELRKWRSRQALEKEGWTADHDYGQRRVFTRSDGAPLTGDYVSVRFAALAYRSGLPPIRFHDLRHGAASLAKAAGLDTKYISALLGHSKTSFTDRTYVTLFPEILKEAAEAAAAVVPRNPAGSAPIPGPPQRRGRGR